MTYKEAAKLAGAALDISAGEKQSLRKTIDALVAALEQSNDQIKIWISVNGDMVGALAQQVAVNDAALALVKPT